MRTLRCFWLLLILIGLSACATTPGGQRWSAAAHRAVLSPATWAPLAGAAVLAATDWDEQVAAWATNHHPVFGSDSAAETGSDLLLAAEAGIYGATALTAPRATLRQRATADGSALLAAAATTGGLKFLTHRSRPDHSDHRSFPSLHTALGAGLATLTDNNLARLDPAPPHRLLGRIGLAGLTAATGWARIEAGRHYPSDVLAGAGVGYFFSTLLAPAGAGKPSAAQTHLTIFHRGTVLVGFSGSF